MHFEAGPPTTQLKDPTEPCFARLASGDLRAYRVSGFPEQSCVEEHAAGAHDLRQITTGHNRGRLVVDAALEPSGAPIHELDGALGLDGSHCGVYIFWHDIAT